MKTSLDLRSTMIGAILGGLAALTIAATADKGSTGWEYSVVTEHASYPTHPAYAENHAAQLNTLASKGWEVVCSHTIAQEGLSGTREIILKRTMK